MESAHSVLLQVISICYGCFFLGQYIAAIKVKPNSDGNATVAVRLNVDTSGRFILVWSYAGPEGNLTSYIYNIICQIYN